MKVEMSYLVELENGTKAWLAVNKVVPEDATVLENRPVIMPEQGKVLRHKETGDISTGHWLKDDSADNWEEIDEPQEEQGAE
jgi:hypothetical protein